MHTATETREQAITLREADLLEAAIVALESGEYEQCTGMLRAGNRYCAEGVLADVLVRAYPERFSWLGYALNTRGCGVLNVLNLPDDGWECLHPSGRCLSWRAGEVMECRSVSEANDYGHTFPQIAAALRQARAEIEAETKGGA